MTAPNTPVSTSPRCAYGYPLEQCEELLGEEYPEFVRWMTGQTAMLCQGRQYNYETKEWELSLCNGDAHGQVVYRWDYDRFVDTRGGTVAPDHVPAAAPVRSESDQKPVTM